MRQDGVSHGASHDPNDARGSSGAATGRRQCRGVVAELSRAGLGRARNSCGSVSLLRPTTSRRQQDRGVAGPGHPGTLSPVTALTAGPPHQLSAPTGRRSLKGRAGPGSSAPGARRDLVRPEARSRRPHTVRPQATSAPVDQLATAQSAPGSRAPARHETVMIWPLGRCPAIWTGRRSSGSR